MSVPAPSIIDTRRHQMFPTLASAEIERLRRFGVLRSYGAGEALVKVGEVGPRPDDHPGGRSPNHPARSVGAPRAHRHTWARCFYG